MKKKIVFAILITLIIVHVNVVNALRIRVENYMIDLGNNLKFYMTFHPSEDIPESGLYQDGNLIYSLDHEFTGDIFLSNDGMSFIHIIDNLILEWETSLTTAVRFFYRGELKHEYDYTYFLSGSRYESNGISTNWQISDKRIHNFDHNRLKITTVENKEFIFDLTTGLITDEIPEDVNQDNIEKKIENKGIIVILIMGVTTILVVTINTRKKQERKKQVNA